MSIIGKVDSTYSVNGGRVTRSVPFTQQQRSIGAVLLLLSCGFRQLRVMFVKKDVRKIEEILVDETDKREVLRLSKRAPEFEGNITKLCCDSTPLMNLRVLNLYNNRLKNLEGIGILINVRIL